MVPKVKPKIRGKNEYTRVVGMPVATFPRVTKK
jgi:hypothetical protein